MKNCDIEKRSFIIIPEEVEYNNNLSEGAKLIFGRVASLSRSKGYCFASNGFFAKKYKRTNQCISKWIKQLEREKLIKIEYVGELGKQERRLSIIIDTLSTTVEGVSTTVEGVSIIIEHNNISNNISNNIREREGAREEIEGEDVSDFYKFEEPKIIELVSAQKNQDSKIEDEGLAYQGAIETMRNFFKDNPGQIETMIFRTSFTGDWESSLNDFWGYYCDNGFMIKNPLKYIGKFEQWMKREKEFKPRSNASTSFKAKPTNGIITKETFTDSIDELLAEGYG